MIVRGVFTGLLAIVLAFGLATFVFSQHSSWHDRYTSAAGTRCCDKDCIQAAGRLLGQTPEGVTLEVNAVVVVLPPKSVHASEDGAFWVCLVGLVDPKALLRSEQIRCAFLATGG